MKLYTLIATMMIFTVDAHNIRKALYLAYNTLTSPEGIGFHDFLLFMQHYRPRLSKHNVI